MRNFRTITKGLDQVQPKADRQGSTFDWTQTKAELPYWTITTGKSKMTLETYVSRGPSVNVYIPVGSKLADVLPKEGMTIDLKDFTEETYDGRGRNAGSTMRRFKSRFEGLEVKVTGIPQDANITTIIVADPVK